MKNQFADFKTLLKTFSYDDQIYLINQKINELVNTKQRRNMIDDRYEQITVLKHIKNNIIKWNKLLNSNCILIYLIQNGYTNK